MVELDQLFQYPDSQIAPWIAGSCSGLPSGSPSPATTSLEFVRQLRDVLGQMAADWDKGGKPKRIVREADA
ncbi:hypothetical protein VM98_03130 [Streptomyces rubellomurinus subsp. indigoferus]|nr:hypothetical protein VM98_03130 [Streptomyces rubellomurinus subsp. indigoferus]